MKCNVHCSIDPVMKMHASQLNLNLSNMLETAIKAVMDTDKEMDGYDVIEAQNELGRIDKEMDKLKQRQIELCAKIDAYKQKIRQNDKDQYDDLIRVSKSIKASGIIAEAGLK